ncbi:Flocculation suppression protein [Coemansia sp. RSA 1200]|nr:Flocculation suppression protein [Coemansia sp. RSA 1200]
MVATPTPPHVSVASAKDDASAAATATALLEKHQQVESSGGASLSAQKPRLLIQKTHAAFVSKLYAMVADKNTDALISWSAEGDSFKVTDPVEFARQVLPAYFKHGNWQSFVRQLNMYGFHKISDLAYGGIFGDAQLWMFKHYSFRRGELKQLQNIKRRGPKAVATAQNTSPQMSAASPGSASELLVSTAELPQGAAPAPSAPATPTLVASSNNAQPLMLPVATASASPSPNEAVGASAFGFSMDDHVVDLKRNIAGLQQSNTLLHRENQAMRAKIADIQGAFAGIVGFLEAAIVRPATTHHAHGAETISPVVEAFKKLANDISPALSHPYSSEHQERSTDFLQPAPFRAGRWVQPQWTADSYHHHHEHSCSKHQHPHSYLQQASGHSCSCTAALPPVRPGCCAQPGTFAHISNLSPPSQELPAAAAPVDTRCFDHSFLHSRARRSSSTSSGTSSSGGSTILDGGCGELKERKVGSFIASPPQAGGGGSWSRQPYSNHLESSLRETLPAKRPRIQ